MSSSHPEFDVLLVGAGGIGAPASAALLAAGITSVLVLDDDAVELSNLHRQIWFEDADVGQPKAASLCRALARRWPGATLEALAARALPETALGLVGRARVVLDGTDNFASRFLLADAGVIAGVPVVHAATVRWRGTCFVGGGPAGRPCYRCLFEDLPEGPAPDCAGAGVVGPVCGVIGAVAADAVVRLLAGGIAAEGVLGTIASFDGLRGVMRRVGAAPRAGCLLCGAAPEIRSLERERYVRVSCEPGLW